MKYFAFPVALLLLAGLVYTPAVSSVDQPPAPPKVSSITRYNASLVWPAITEAGRYEIAYGTDPDASNRDPFFSERNQTSLPRLMPNTIYHVKYRPILKGQAGPWSNIITFSTDVPAVQQIETEEIGTTFVTFTWSARYGDLPDIFYDIARTTDEKSDPVKIGNTNKARITIRDLQPSQTYFFKIRMRNPLKNGPWSPLYRITTRADLRTSAPSKVLVKSLNPKEVLLTWQSVANSLAYECRIIFPNGRSSIVTSKETHLNLVLHPNENYQFKIRATTIGDKTQWSPAVSLLTLPEIPLEVTVAAQTVNETILNWAPPSGKGSGLTYEISWGTSFTASNLGVLKSEQASVTFSKLRPNTTYYAKVRSVNATGKSGWSSYVSFTTLPEKLNNIIINHITHQSAEVEWPAVERAVTYELSYGSDFDASQHSLSDLKKTSLVLRDLIPDLNYYVKIRPVLPKMVYGAWSSITAFKTLPVPELAKTPRVDKVTAHEIDLSWSSIPNSNKYEIMISRDQALIDGRKIMANELQSQLTGLQSNQRYYIKLRGINDGGPGDWSPSVAATTAPAGPPENLAATDINPYDTVISWEPAAGNGQLVYNVRYAIGSADWEEINGLSIYTHQLTNLTPNTTYHVQVNSHNPSGTTAWSKEISFQTPPAPPQEAPAGLAITKLTDISLECNWHRMPKVSGYIISYGTDTDAINLGEIKTQRIRQSFKNLVPESPYYFKVKSYNETGESPWSGILYAFTKTTPPMNAPANVTLMDPQPFSVSLNWTTSLRVNYYEVSAGSDPEAGSLGDPVVVQDPPYTYNRLEPDMTYYIKVRQVNNGGPGPWSRIIKFQTPTE